MEKILAKAPLFQGIPEGERVGLLERLGAEVRRFPKAGAVCRNGDPAVLGVVLFGGLTVENVDVWGNKTILDHIAPGQVFGEAFACAGEPMGVSVTAAEESEVLLLRGEGLLEARGCPATKGFCGTCWSFPHGRTCGCPGGASTRRPRPSGGGCSPIFRTRPWPRAAGRWSSPLTGSSWRTIWGWTAAPCPTS